MNHWNFLFIALLGLFGLIQFHEQMHVEIFSKYGVDSYVTWTEEFPHVATIPEEPCPTEVCTLANNINDIIGWPLVLLYSIWTLIMFDKYLNKEF